jgi:hypothetical protein
MNIIDKALNPKKDKYNILTFDTHERYQTQLCKTGHNFYSFRYENCKEWDTKYAPIPENYYILPKGLLVHGMYFDFILSQSKFGQFQASQQINRTLNVPIISLEHTLPLPDWSNGQLEYFKSMIGDFNVFISAYSISQWNMNCASSIIHHSVDTNLFSPREKPQEDCEHDYVLSVVNDFKNRDHCCNYSGWERVTAGLKVKLVGNNPGLSLPAASPEVLADEYRSAGVFLNTSTVSPVPTSLLEAMACGCAVVSTATCMIPEIIKNGVNGFCSNDEEELREYLGLLLYDKDLAKRVGENARATILKNFSEQEFINKWNSIFDAAYGVKK